MYCHPFVNPKTNLVGEGLKFERIRRVTGYLVGTLDRFNILWSRSPPPLRRWDECS